MLVFVYTFMDMELVYGAIILLVTGFVIGNIIFHLKNPNRRIPLYEVGNNQEQSKDVYHFWIRLRRMQIAFAMTVIPLAIAVVAFLDGRSIGFSDNHIILVTVGIFLGTMASYFLYKYLKVLKSKTSTMDSLPEARTRMIRIANFSAIVVLLVSFLLIIFAAFMLGGLE